MKSKKKKSGRIFTAAVSILICATFVFSVSPFAAAVSNRQYTYSNPYSDVDFSSWGSYKTQMHCHTNASDGFLTIKEFCQAHYDEGYDIVAVTDHGTINQGWNKAPNLVPLIRLVKYDRTKNAAIVPLSDEEYESYLNGTHATTNGTVRTCGMLDVPKGIELNMATPVADCHLTGYFSDYGQGLAGVYGDYETPSAGVKDAGGISMLAHVGEYVYNKKDSADHVGQVVDEYYANKFARIFLDDAGSSMGMGVNSATDAHTRCDRILYDEILNKTIPDGVCPWGYTFSDSHTSTSINDAYVYTLMDSFDMDTFRSSISSGKFFSVSHYSNGVELNGMKELSEDYLYQYQDGNNGDWAMATNDTPLITSLSLDETQNTITVKATNASEITFVGGGGTTGGIAGGQVLTRLKLKDSGETDANGYEVYTQTIDLDDYNFSLYVRCYVSGKNGICYANPITCIEKGKEPSYVTVPATQDLSTALRSFVTILDNLIFKWAPIVWAFKYFALGYDPFSQWK